MPDQSVKSALEGPRPARLEERDELIAMINLVFRTSVGREPTIATDWPHVYEPENLMNVMVVSARDMGNDRGQVVASTGVWVSDVIVRTGKGDDVKLRVGGINCVGTLPEYRRHGLGSQVMEAAQRKMADLGCHVGLLATGISNWYRRLGWEEAGSSRSYRLNRANIGLLPHLRPGIAARFVEDGEVETGGVDSDIVRLHNQNRLGAIRITEKFRQLYTARKRPRILLAESEGKAVAYLLVREHTIVEWAGEAEVVAGLVRTCFELLDDLHSSTSQRNIDGRAAALRTLTLVTPGWQHPLVKLLDVMRIPYAIDYLGMIYVVDPQALLDAYALSSLAVKADGNEFVLTQGANTLKLTRNRLTKLFFGPERVDEFASDTFPLAFWQWQMEKV